MKFKHLVVTGALCLSSIFAAKAQDRKKAIDIFPPVNKTVEDSTMTANAAIYRQTVGNGTMDVSSFARLIIRFGYDADKVTPKVNEMLGFAIISSTIRKQDMTVIAIHALSDWAKKDAVFTEENLAGQEISVISGDRALYASTVEQGDEDYTYKVTKTLYGENETVVKTVTEIQPLQVLLKELKALGDDPKAFLDRFAAAPVPKTKPSPAGQ